MSHQLHSFFLWTKLFLHLYLFFMELSCEWVSRALPHNNADWLYIGCFFLLCQTQSGASTLRVSPQGNKQLRQTGSGRLWGRFSLRTLPTLWNVSHVVFVWYAARVCLVPSGIIYIYKKKKLLPLTLRTSQTQSEVSGGQGPVFAVNTGKNVLLLWSHTHTHPHTQRRSRRTGCILHETKTFCLAVWVHAVVLPLVATSWTPTNDEPTYQRIPFVCFPPSASENDNEEAAILNLNIRLSVRSVSVC